MDIDWLILTQYAKKLTCDEILIVIHKYIQKYVNLSINFQSIHMLTSTFGYDTVEVENRLKLYLKSKALLKHNEAQTT